MCIVWTYVNSGHTCRPRFTNTHTYTLKQIGICTHAYTRWPTIRIHSHTGQDMDLVEDSHTHRNRDSQMHIYRQADRYTHTCIRVDREYASTHIQDKTCIHLKTHTHTMTDTHTHTHPVSNFEYKWDKLSERDTRRFWGEAELTFFSSPRWDSPQVKSWSTNHETWRQSFT